MASPIVIWTSLAAKTLYVRELGNVTSGPIAGVMSCDTLDITNYDNSNYRDDFFDPGASGPKLEFAFDAGFDYVTQTTAAGVFTAGTPPTSKSSTDAVYHIPPRNEMKQRTMVRLWDAASGTGNVLYSGWADEIVSFSLASYTFI